MSRLTDAIRASSPRFKFMPEADLRLAGLAVLEAVREPHDQAFCDGANCKAAMTYSVTPSAAVEIYQAVIASLIAEETSQ